MADRIAAPTNGDGDDILSLNKDLAARTAELTAARAQQAETAAALDQARQQLDAANTEMQASAQELGRLKAIADRHEGLRAQRDALQQQVTTLATTFQAQTADAVRTALEQANAQQEAAAAQWAQERQTLLQKIDDLEKGAAGGEPAAMAPTDLAAHFASVLESLAEGTGSTAARGYSASLTSIDVEAKGLLQAPAAGGDEPMLHTLPPGAVDPGQLSIVRMSFRLLPQVSGLEGGGEEA